MNDPWISEPKPPGWWSRLSGGRRAAIVIATLVALWIASFVPFPSYYAPSRANAPTLQIGDHFRVNRLAYVYGGPDRGDLAVFDAPVGFPRRVGRIVGLGGDTLEGRDGHLVRNGQPVKEHYLAADVFTNGFGPVTLHLQAQVHRRPQGHHAPPPHDAAQGDPEGQ